MEMVFPETILRKEQEFFHDKSIGKNVASHQRRAEISRKRSAIFAVSCPR